MEEQKITISKADNVGVTIVVREEEMEGGKVFIVNNEDLGVADFGDTLDEALANFKCNIWRHALCLAR